MRRSISHMAALIPARLLAGTSLAPEPVHAELRAAVEQFDDALRAGGATPVKFVVRWSLNA